MHQPFDDDRDTEPTKGVLPTPIVPIDFAAVEEELRRRRPELEAAIRRLQRAQVVTRKVLDRVINI
jgi:hypothetical protein